MTREDPTPSQAARYDELLEAAVDHVIDHGLAQLSIRKLGSALGVAHNTVTYHFGGKGDLTAAIFTRLAARMRVEADPDLPNATLEELVSARFGSIWTWLSDEQRRPMWLAFLEALALAARDPETFTNFIKHLEADSVTIIAQELELVGLADDVARARATMITATIRGLMIDLAFSGPAGEARVNAGFDSLVQVITTWVKEIGGESD